MSNCHTFHPLVSVIVAAYNVEQWLHDCLDSISKQTYQNWECIIVNDGSEDKTRDVALGFCMYDQRFKLIDKFNEGVSTVRNVGLDNAKGYFIQFIDGDDMLTVDCLEYCVKNIDKSHVLACDCVAVTEKGKFIRQTSQGINKELDRTQALRWTMDRKLLSSVWSKFYKKDTIGTLKFNHALRGGQDIYFNAELLLMHPEIKIKVSNYPTYKYRIIGNSVSHVRDSARIKRQLVLVSEMNCLYENHKATINQECLDEFARNMIREFLFYYSLQGLIKKTDVSLIPLMRKWHALIVDKDSNEFHRSKFVEKELSIKTDLLLTVKYLPETIRGYIKTFLWQKK